ncbi:MAG TPA: hypothetical protein VM712_17165, partial [Gaiellales bacterium]|nr:hypothetical protein [Gaiellales bacterium]
ACGPSRGELVVDWTFEGLSCADAGVATIFFSVANETVSPDHFDCLDSRGQPISGVDLGSYLAGDYQVTVTGVDAAGFTTHESTQTVRVAAGRQNEYAIDAAQLQVTTGSANLTWTFEGKSCAAAAVDKVRILVDPNPDGTGGTGLELLDCSTAGTDGGSVSSLDPGTHTFAIIGFRTVNGRLTTVYRTHHPAAGFIAVGADTSVAVSAESLP